jgi:hypothetical protein
MDELSIAIFGTCRPKSSRQRNRLSDHRFYAELLTIATIRMTMTALSGMDTETLKKACETIKQIRNPNSPVHGHSGISNFFKGNRSQNCTFPLAIKLI